MGKCTVARSHRKIQAMPLLLWSLVCGCLLHVIEANDIKARHGPSDSKPSGAASTFSMNLEDLWARETAAAQAELHRFLQGQYRFQTDFSMPVGKPTSNPTEKPLRDLETPQPGPTSATFAPQTSRPTPPNGSCLAGRTPEQYLLDEMLKLSTVNLLLDADLPQGMAFNFILADPTVRDDVCGYATLAQRFGLGTLNMLYRYTSSHMICSIIVLFHRRQQLD